MVERHQVRLRLALPWWQRMLEQACTDATTEVRLPAAEWLVARGRVRDVRIADWRKWLLEPVDGGAALLQRFPAGPCVRAASSDQRPEGTWACARPVHLLTAIDHLQLAPSDVTLDAADRDRLLTDLNGHFGDRGFRFHGSGATVDWQVEFRGPAACDGIEPDRATGRNLRELMPTGPDAPRVRALMNEVQMLLHEHPVNTLRAARGLPAVNSLWLWGFGCLDDGAAPKLPALTTNDGWLAGLWRLSGSAVRSIAKTPIARDLELESLFAWSRPDEADALAAINRAEALCLEPARSSLDRGRVDEIEVLLGEQAVVVDRVSRFRFWRRTRPIRAALA